MNSLFKPTRPGIVDAVAKFAWRAEPVGSRRSVKPAPTDTDDDWLIYCTQERINRLRLKADKPKKGEKAPSSRPGPEFTSLRFGDVNLICTSSGRFFDAFMAAQAACTRLNLKDKNDRIAVFRAVLYSEEC